MKKKIMEDENFYDKKNLTISDDLKKNWPRRKMKFFEDEKQKKTSRPSEIGVKPISSASPINNVFRLFLAH